MADIDLIIKIPEEAKQAFDCAESNDLKGGYYDHGGVIGNAIKNGTPIPDNATNGDIVQMMFPNVNVYEHNGGATYSVNNEYNFNATWWNAPYQKGGK